MQNDMSCSSFAKVTEENFGRVEALVESHFFLPRMYSLDVPLYKGLFGPKGLVSTESISIILPTFNSKSNLNFYTRIFTKVPIVE